MIAVAQTDIALITTNQIDIGIRILSGVLRGAGYTTRLINLSSREGWCPTRYPEWVKDQLLPLLGDCGVVGISTVDLFFRRAQDLAQWLKARMGKRVLMGGIHTQLYPEESLATVGVDGVCIGEGLRSLPALLDQNDWETVRIDDFWLKRKDGSVHRGGLLPMVNSQEIHQLPLPDYSYDDYWLLQPQQESIISLRGSDGCFPIEQHQIGRPNSFVASFMFGCPNHCNFCNITALSQKWKGRHPRNQWFRIKPNAVVREELRLIKAHNPSMRFMCIMDNDFTARPTRDVNEFFEFFKREMNVPVYLMVSPNTLNEEKLRTIVEGGVVEINMGIESNEVTNIRMYGRSITDSTVLDAARMINQYKDRLYPFYDLVIFNAEETDEDLLRTIHLIRSLPLPFDLVPHHLTLGTETLLYKKLEAGQRAVQRPLEAITTSDYHEFNFAEYASWPTLYLNLLLEWMGGPHSEIAYGRLPRRFENLRAMPTFAHWLKDAGLPATGEDTLDVLTSRPITDYFRDHVGVLQELHDSLGHLVFSNQESVYASAC